MPRAVPAGGRRARIVPMPQAPAYPLFLNLVQQPVLVVGGGSVGLRKTRGLIECAARVTVVSPVFAPGFEKIQDVERIEALYAATHMARKLWRLVFAATNRAEVNQQVQKHAEAAGTLCCRADEPDEGDFSSGASVRVGATRKPDGRGVRAAGNIGGLVLAISTAGASPVLAARICREAAQGIDPVLPVFADLLADWRGQIKATIADLRVRRELLQRLAGEEMEAVVRNSGKVAAQRVFEQWYEAARTTEAGKAAPPAASAIWPAPAGTGSGRHS
jgi:precorrin-2 dehydrogenase / sirohydrochlorin ferrochelatase